MRFTAFLVATGALALPAFAQDSVSKTPCLPGDAVNAWDVTEQCDAYVVDMSLMTGSWGTQFGIAPIVKTSKMDTTHFNALISTQAISRRQRIGVPFPVPGYALWTLDPGTGVNNNPAINDPAPFIPAPASGNRFGVAFAEFGTTDAPASQSYNAVIGAAVNYEPSNPKRLYVRRVNAALNSCDPTSNLSQFGMGSVDEDGHVMIRADNFGVANGCGGLIALAGNNYFEVSMGLRSCGQRNVVSNDWVAGGQFDKPATDWLVRNSATTHGTASIMPSSVTGGAALVLGSNFNNEFVRGPAFGSIIANTAQFPPGAVATRGGVAYTSRTCSFLGGTAGIGAMLFKIGAAANPTRTIGVWGLTPAGGVTGTAALALPGLVTDPTTGYTNQTLFGAGGTDEFDHYHSQTAQRGGNSQVALGIDQAGNLLAAAQVNLFFQPAANPFDWPYNYIAVARMNCQTGNVQWTMAGYNDDASGSNLGKPILDAGGNTIGRMCLLSNVTGGVPQGPSVSAPMIDSVGNVWFISAFVHIDANGVAFDPDSGLIRAVYDRATFSYKLELITSTGRTFLGQNSGTRWQLRFLSIADSNSVDSATAWSGNISETAHLGGPPSTALPTKAAESLGGLVIGAEIVYDFNGDGTFNATGCANGPDQAYDVLLYIGAVTPATTCLPCDTNCDGTVNQFDINSFIAVISGGAPCGAGCAGDTNGDGTANQFDINGFITCLGG